MLSQRVEAVDAFANEEFQIYIFFEIDLKVLRFWLDW
jgi:hypothetical protein